MSTGSNKEINMLIEQLDKARALYTEKLAADKRRQAELYSIALWRCSVLALSDTSLSAQGITNLIRDIQVNEATIGDYMLCRATEALKTEFTYMKGFGTRLNLKQIDKLYRILTDKEIPANPDIAGAYRTRSAFIDEIPCSAPGPGRIPELMDVIQQEILSREHYEIPVIGAIRTHDMIAAAWPYPEHNDLLAYVCMSYELYSAGYMLPVLNITGAEHRALCGEFRRTGASYELTRLVIESIGAQYQRALG